MPSDRVAFLTVDEVIEIHAEVIRRFGGEPSIRDLGLLESALYRPRTGYYDDVVAMAAALFESLLVNHPFIDGNKRVAFFATDVFLRLNGWRLDVPAKQGEKFILSLLEDRAATFERVSVWIRSHIQVAGNTR